MTLSRDEILRYSQQMKLDDIGYAGQEKLKQARVLCIGAGGLGSPALLYLAAAGVGTIGIIDDDRIELSNLHRQIIYRCQDIGHLKVEAAGQQLSALNPAVQVNLYSEKLQAQNAQELISHYDIVIDGCDDFATRYLAHDTCLSQNKPYVYASVNQYRGYASFFDGQQGACLRCLFPEPPDDTTILSCEAAGVLGVVPGVMGMIQASETLKWILGIGKLLQGRLLKVDMLSMTFQEITLVKNPACDRCCHE